MLKGAVLVPFYKQSGSGCTLFDLAEYLAKRSCGFCEGCGVPGKQWGGSSQLQPRSKGAYVRGDSLYLCSACMSHLPQKDLTKKPVWLEETLAQKELLYVTAAAIRSADRFLLCQKSSGLWEFPGGKVQPGEDLRQGLVREIKEELNLDIVVEDPFGLADHDYGHIKLRLFGFICKALDLSALELKEHKAAEWRRLDELETLELADADVVLEAMLRRYVFRLA